MPNNGYSRLYELESNHICEECLTKLPAYSIKWNNKTFKCIPNNCRAVTLYSKKSAPVSFNYRDIKSIELRSWMKTVLVLADREIILSGFRRKSIFNVIRGCFTRQLLYV
ncbi:MAG: hypothetical protein ACR2M6_02910 [Vampirovibrionia bacterium]